MNQAPNYFKLITVLSGPQFSDENINTALPFVKYEEFYTDPIILCDAREKAIVKYYYLGVKPEITYSKFKNGSEIVIIKYIL